MLLSVLYKRDHDYNAKGSSYDADIPYQWFDFQPASRVLHALYSLHFLRDFACITAEERAEIAEMVRENAEVIFLGEEACELHIGI